MRAERSIIVPVKILHGSIKCAKCENTLHGPGACPKCGYTHVVIRIGWRGQTYRFYCDKNLRAHDFSSAAVDLATQNGEIAAGNFDPKKWLKPVIQARRFQNAWDEFMCDKIEEIEMGRFAPSTWHMYQTHCLVWLKPVCRSANNRKKESCSSDDHFLTSATSSDTFIRPSSFRVFVPRYYLTLLREAFDSEGGVVL